MDKYEIQTNRINLNLSLFAIQNDEKIKPQRNREFIVYFFLCLCGFLLDSSKSAAGGFDCLVDDFFGVCNAEKRRFKL